MHRNQRISLNQREEMLKKISKILGAMREIFFYTEKNKFQERCEKEIKACCETIRQKCVELEEIFDDIYEAEIKE